MSKLTGNLKKALCFVASFALAASMLPASALAQQPDGAGALNAGVISAQAGFGIADISHGYDCSAALMSNGSLWMWGDNGFGELGDGTTEARYLPMKMLRGVSQISMGGGHSAAIKLDGSLWTWGWNDRGQLGDGTTEDQLSPVKVMDGASQVALGAYHSAAIKSDGSLWMWGENTSGQLGDGTTDDHYLPVKVMDGVSQVALGDGYSAAIKTDGSLWMWGSNNYGELGDGTTEEHYSPVKVMDGVSQVSLGAGHTAVIKSDSTLWTWGWNESGQLGDGTTVDRSSPVKVMDGVSQVSLVSDDSVAVKSDGSLWAWGANRWGWLGDGTTTNRRSPVKVMDGVSQASVCIAVKSDGSLWTWGPNFCGDVGDGTTEKHYSPICIFRDGEWLYGSSTVVNDETLDDPDCNTSTESLDRSVRDVARIVTDARLLCFNLTRQGISEVIPGMRQTHVRSMRTGKPEACYHMCPQGVCTIAGYRLVSAYCTEKEHESVLYVLDATTGEYLTTLLLKGNMCHVGAIADGPDDDDELAAFIVDSGPDDTTATSGTIWSLKYSTIQDAVNTGSDCCAVDLHRLFDVDINPSFLCRFGSKLLVGDYWGDKVRSWSIEDLNYNYHSFMYAYDIKTGQRSEIKIALPTNCQGVEVCEYRGNLYMFASCSCAGPVKSRVMVGALIPTNGGWFANGCLNGKAIFGGFNFPEMCEDLDITGGALRTCYESAANKYRYLAYIDTPILGQAYMIDRITESSAAHLIKLYRRGTVEALEFATWGDGGLATQGGGADPALEAYALNAEESDLDDGDEGDEIVASGSCGDDICWTLYGDGSLELSGYGNMDDYSSMDETPWADHASEISAVYVGADVRHVGAHAFEGCTSLASVDVSQYMPAGTEFSIGDYAFAGCTALGRISLPDGVGCTYGDDALPGGCAEHVHQYALSEHVDATCANPGYDLYTCECGAEQARDLEDPLGHEYELVHEAEATCEAPGAKTYLCSGCGTPAYEEVEATGHSWGKPKWSWSANKKSATATFTCSNDGSHVEKLNATVKSSASNGVTTYTATVVHDGASYTSKATVGVAIGKTAVAAGSTYKALSSTTVAFVKAKNAKSVAVPPTVTLNGRVYKVVQVNANAFKGAKIRTVTVGKNVKKLASKAFNGSKATKVVVKSKSFGKSASVKGCFKGAKKLTTVQVKVGTTAQNKKYVKIYKKTLGKKSVSGKEVAVK